LAAIVRAALDEFGRNGVTEAGGQAMARATAAAIALAGELDDPAQKRMAVRCAAAMDVITRCSMAWIAGAR
jgi:hypothetical protein